MTQSCNVLRLGFLAARAGVGLDTLLRAGRLLGDNTVVPSMTQCLDLLGSGLTALLAGVELFALLSAGRLLGDLAFIPDMLADFVLDLDDLFVTLDRGNFVALERLDGNFGVDIVAVAERQSCKRGVRSNRFLGSKRKRDLALCLVNVEALVRLRGGLAGEGDLRRIVLDNILAVGNSNVFADCNSQNVILSLTLGRRDGLRTLGLLDLECVQAAGGSVHSFASRFQTCLAAHLGNIQSSHNIAAHRNECASLHCVAVLFALCRSRNLGNVHRSLGLNAHQLQQVGGDRITRGSGSCGVQAGDTGHAVQLADLAGGDSAGFGIPLREVCIVDGSVGRISDQQAVAVSQRDVVHGHIHGILERHADVAEQAANERCADLFTGRCRGVPNRNGDELIQIAIRVQDIVDMAGRTGVALRDRAAQHAVDHIHSDVADVGDRNQIGIAGACTPAGEAALDVIGQLIQAVGVGDVERIAEGRSRMDVVLALGQREGDSRVLSHIAHRVAGGALAALRFLKGSRVHLVDVTSCVIDIGAPQCAGGVACAVELRCVVAALRGDRLGAEIDLAPGSAVFVGDLCIDRRVNIDIALDGDVDVLGDMLAGRVGVNGGNSDSRAALASAGDDTVLNGRNIGVRGAPGQFIGGAEDDLGGDLLAFANIDGDVRRVDLQGQVGRSVVLIQGDNRPDLFAEAADLSREQLSGIDGVQLRSLAVLIGGDQQIAGSLIVDHGSVLAAGDSGDVGQLQTGIAEVFHNHGVALATVVGEHIELIQLAALGHSIVEVRRAIGVAVPQVVVIIGAAADEGNDSQRIVCKALRGKIKGGEGTLSRVEQFHVGAVHADADHFAKQAFLHCGRRSRVGPLPGRSDGAVGSDLERVGINTEHRIAASVVDQKLALVESTCDIAGAFRDLRPALGVVGAELRPVSLAVRAVDQSACLDLGQSLNGDVADVRERRVCLGGNRDVSLADCQRLDLAVLVNRDNVGVVARPGDGLVGGQPRDNARGKLIGAALEERQRMLAQLDLGNLRRRGQGNGVGRNNIQAHEVIVELVCTAAGDELRSFRSLGVDDPQLVIDVAAALDAVSAGQIQCALRLIVSHGGVAGDIHTGLADLFAVQRQSAVSDLVQRVLIQMNVAAACRVDAVELAVGVDGQRAQCTACSHAAGMIDRDVGDLGQLAAHKIHRIQLVAGVVGIDGASGDVSNMVGQDVHGLILGVHSHVGDHFIGVKGCREGGDLLRVVQLVLRSGIEAVSGGEEDILACVLGSIDLHAGISIVGHALGLGQRGGIDLDPARAIAAVGAGGEAEHSAREVLGRAAVFDLVADFVARVVSDRNGDIFAGCVGQREYQTAFLASLILRRNSSHLRAVDRQELLAACIVEAHESDVLVVLSDNGQRTGHHVLLNVEQFRSRIIDRVGVGEVSALTQLAGGDQLFDRILIQRRAILVILGDQDDACGELVAFLEAKGCDLLVGRQAGLRLLPAGAIGVVVSTEYLIRDAAHVKDLVRGLILDEVGRGRSVADHAHRVLCEGAAGVNGGTIVGDLVLDHIRVDRINGLVLLARILDRVVVGVRGQAQIGGTGVAVQLLDQRGGIEHGSIGPVAVEAEHRDGVYGEHCAVVGVVGANIDVALDIRAIGVILVKVSLGLSRQLDGDLDVDRRSDRNLHSVRLHLGEEEIGIVGVDLAILVDIGNSQVISGAVVRAGGVVQDRLSIRRVGLTVLVDVAFVADRGDDGLAVYIIGHVGCQGSSQQIHHERSGIAVLAIAGCENILREQVGGEGVLLHGAGEVVDGELEAVFALALGVVAEFGLDLAVSGSTAQVVLHQDVARRADSVADIAKAGALIHNRIDVFASIVVVALERRCGGHQQAVGQRAGVQTGLFVELVLTDVLAHHSRHTGDLRGGHGGTGHRLISGVAGMSAFAVMRAVDGVDAAARSGDLRLELQRARNTPGAEGAHGVMIGAIDHRADALVDGHGAGRIRRILSLCGGVPDRQAVSHRDGDARSGLAIVGQVHVDNAGCVVVNDGCDRACVDRVLALHIEGDAAALHEHDLTGHVDAFIVFGIAGDACGQDDIVMRTGQRFQLGVGIIGLVPEHVLVTNGEVAAGEAVVVNGSHRQRVGEGSGRAVHLHGDIVRIQVAELCVLSPVAGVAGGHADNGAAVGEARHDLGIVIVDTAEAGAAGAEGQVHGVAAEHDSVFDCDHIVGIIRAAARAKDLHDNELCVRSNALHLHGVQCACERAVSLLDIGVGRRDALNVRAMLALRVMHMVDGVVLVDVVVSKRDLGTDISLVRADLAAGSVQLRQNIGGQVGLRQNARFLLVLVNAHALETGNVRDGVLIASSREGLLLVIDTSIDHGDLAASAGVACCPSSAGADLRRRGSHVRIIGLVLVDHHGFIAVFNENLLDALNLCDLFDLLVADVCRNDVAGKGQVPNNVDAVLQGCVDFLDHAVLLALQAVAVSDGCGAQFSRPKLFDSGGIFQHDGDTNDFALRVLRVPAAVNAFFVQYGLRKLFGNRIVQLFKLQLCSLAASCGERRNNKSDAHRKDEEHGKKTDREMFLHILSFFQKTFTMRGQAWLVPAAEHLSPCRDITAQTDRLSFFTPIPTVLSVNILPRK